MATTKKTKTKAKAVKEVKPKSAYAPYGKKLTTVELACVYLHVFGEENDWKKLYYACAGIHDDTPKTRTEVQGISIFKNSIKIQDAIKRVTEDFAARLAKAREEGFNEGRLAAFGETGDAQSGNRPGKGGRPAIIDYSDPAAQKSKLNEIINTAKDSGEALDALKVIIQGQKNDAEAAKDKQIQRFYTPVQCRTCEIKQVYQALYSSKKKREELLKAEEEAEARKKEYEKELEEAEAVEEQLKGEEEEETTPAPSPSLDPAPDEIPQEEEQVAPPDVLLSFD